MKVTIMKELAHFSGNACLVQVETGEYFVVSSADAPFTGPETLVFRADKNGKVTDWSEVAGGRGVSRSKAIAEMEAWESVPEQT